MPVNCPKAPRSFPPKEWLMVSWVLRFVDGEAFRNNLKRVHQGPSKVLWTWRQKGITPPLFPWISLAISWAIKLFNLNFFGTQWVSRCPSVTMAGCAGTQPSTELVEGDCVPWRACADISGRQHPDDSDLYTFLTLHCFVMLGPTLMWLSYDILTIKL